jgi:hypothetical protein
MLKAIVNGRIVTEDRIIEGGGFLLMRKVKLRISFPKIPQAVFRGFLKNGRTPAARSSMPEDVMWFPAA